MPLTISMVMNNNLRESPLIVRAYLSYCPFPLAMLRPIEASFYPRILPGPSLDVGCGDGFLARTVFGNSGVTVGIDPNEAVLEKAKKSSAYCEVSLFDGVTIPLRSSSMRSVIANCVLEHVDHPKVLLSEIGRVTAKDGMFFFTTPTVHFDQMLLGSRVLRAAHLAPLAHLYERFMDRVTRQKYYWTKERWIDELRRHGFELVIHREFFGPRALAVFDIAHWLSIPSIATKLLTGRWILLPELRWKTSLLSHTRDWALRENHTIGAFQFFTFRKR